MTVGQRDGRAASAVARARIPEVQTLRAVAVALVMSFHYFISGTESFAGVALYTDAFGQSLAQHGWLGVQLFFMVSGFVIALTLEATPNGRQFAIRRFVRLWPVLVLVLPLLHLVGRWYGYPLERTWQDLLASFTLVDPWVWNSLAGTQFDWTTAVMWTLWIELQFYVVAGICFYGFGSRRFLPALTAVLFALSGVYWIDNVIPQLTNGAYLGLMLPGLDAHALWFLAGVVLFRMWRRPSGAPVTAIDAVILGLCGIANIVQLLAFGSVIPALMTVAYFAVFLAIALKHDGIKLLRWPWLVLIGEISYELYLVHDVIGVTFISTLGRAFGESPALHVVYVALAAALSVGVAYCIHTYWSRPVQRTLRRRFARNPAAPVITPSESRRH
jgi:peptidoglycan/LPS O-acetylase OafA/YrhL